MSERLRTTLVLAAVVTLAIVGSGCAIFKPGSLQLSQLAGIGPVHVHFDLCTATDAPTPGNECESNGKEGEAQQALAFVVPKGTVAPAQFSAVPGPGAYTIRYRRDPSVEAGFAAFAEAEQEVFLPPGFEAIGYLSEPFFEALGPELEWSIDLDLGLPGAADGGPFAGPFAATVFWGWRVVGEGLSADRPLNCSEGLFFASCSRAEEGKAPVSDLKMPPPTAAEAFVGGKASIAFPFDFASTAPTLPSFSLAASTTLPKATLALPNPSFLPGAVAPPTNRSLSTRTVIVSIPPKAKPGSYDVTLTATASGGSSFSQVGKLNVAKPRIVLGKTRFNRAKGTATLSVEVPSAGTLTASGKGVVKTKRNAKAARTLKVTIRARGKAKVALLETGRAKVRAKIAFKSGNGSAVNRTKRLTLQLDT